jgi:hypothetical protein
MDIVQTIKTIIEKERRQSDNRNDPGHVPHQVYHHPLNMRIPRHSKPVRSHERHENQLFRREMRKKTNIRQVVPGIKKGDFKTGKNIPGNLRAAQGNRFKGGKCQEKGRTNPHCCRRKY